MPYKKKEGKTLSSAFMKQMKKAENCTFLPSMYGCILPLAHEESSSQKWTFQFSFPQHMPQPLKIYSWEFKVLSGAEWDVAFGGEVSVEIAPLERMEVISVVPVDEATGYNP